MSIDSTAKIRRAPRSDYPYFMMSRATAQDDALTYEALGMLTNLLSRPDDWSVKVTQLAKRKGSGRDKTYRTLQELIDTGYVVRTVDRTAKGHMVWEYVVYEIPVKVGFSSPLPENPYTENQDAYRLDSSTEKEVGKPPPTQPATLETNLTAHSEPKSTPSKEKTSANKPAKASPQNISPALRSEGKPYPVYDAVEYHVWGIDAADDAPRQWTAPVGGIAKWLTNDLHTWRKTPLGNIGTPATPDDVRRFVEWYQRKQPGASVPRDVVKFTDYWRQWQTVQTTIRQAQEDAPVQADTPRVSMTTAEELAEGRAIREQWMAERAGTGR